MNFGAVYCLYDDTEYLEVSLYSVSKYLNQVLFLISDVPWNGTKIDNSSTVKKVQELCEKNKNYKLIQGHWTNEIDQRNFGLSLFSKQGIDFSFVIDSDEVYKEQHFVNIINFIITNQQIQAFHLEWNTYWKKDYYRINPREDFKPLICVKTNNFLFTFIRGGVTNVHRSGEFVLTSNDKTYNYALIPPNVAICYHLSYARDDEYMKRKLETNSHAPEFIKNWYEEIWEKWTPEKQNLHPVTPQQYQIATKESFRNFPDQLKVFIKKEKISQRTCSIIIPNWNSRELLARCIHLVKKNTKRNYEIVVVDNGSIDDSREFLETQKFKVIYNEKNLGFAGGINSALRTIKDNDICLLNADAEPQENWLEEMFETLENNPNCGIVGPLGNEVESGWQAKNSIKVDTEVPLCMGFCFLILREVIDQIGILDERFEIGGYEDNDYCLRAMMSGFSCILSAKSLVIHKAHQVFEKNNMNYNDLDPINKQRLYEKTLQELLNLSKIYDFYQDEKVAKFLGLKC